MQQVSPHRSRQRTSRTIQSPTMGAFSSVTHMLVFWFANTAILLINVPTKIYLFINYNTVVSELNNFHHVLGVGYRTSGENLYFFFLHKLCHTALSRWSYKSNFIRRDLLEKFEVHEVFNSWERWRVDGFLTHPQPQFWYFRVYALCEHAHALEHQQWKQFYDVLQ